MAVSWLRDPCAQNFRWDAWRSGSGPCWALLGLVWGGTGAVAAVTLVGGSSGACWGAGVTTGRRQSLNFTPVRCGSSSRARTVRRGEDQQLLCSPPPTCSPVLSALGSGSFPGTIPVPDLRPSCSPLSSMVCTSALCGSAVCSSVLGRFFDLDLSPPFCRMACGRVLLAGCCRIRRGARSSPLPLHEQNPAGEGNTWLL